MLKSESYILSPVETKRGLFHNIITIHHTPRFVVNKPVRCLLTTII